MENKSSINSFDTIRVFAKAHPKVTELPGGFMFEFKDVLSVTRQQEIKANNATAEDIQKIVNQDRMGLSKGGDDKQMEFPWFGDK